MVENYILEKEVSKEQTKDTEVAPLVSIMAQNISSIELTKLMQNSLATFFKEHQIHEVLPDNAKIVVLNHESTIRQMITAMVTDQNVQWCAVWDSEKKDFLGIVTIRDLLEMIVFFVESVKETIERDQINKEFKDEGKFVAQFLESYFSITIDHNHVRARSISFRKRSDSGTYISTGSAENLGYRDLSIIELILESIILYEWFNISQEIIKFNKSILTSEITIDDNINTCLTYMNNHSLGFLALINQERTTLQGCITYNDIIHFMVENYQGNDLSYFEEPLSNFDQTYHNLFPTYQKLVIARDTDTVFQCLKKMRDNRVSCIPIERQLSPLDIHTTRTVGLAFQTDIMFLLRLPDFWQHLDDSIIQFVTDLNGLEEDQEIVNKAAGAACDSTTVEDLTQPAKLLSQGTQPTTQKISHQEVNKDEEEESESDEDEDDESSYGSSEEDEEERKRSKKERVFKEINFFQLNTHTSKDLEKQKVANEKELEIEELFGKVFGIERVLLMKKNDTLKEVIEKITLIPENKLVFVDVEQGFPKVKNMLALSDLFAYIAQNTKESK